MATPPLSPQLVLVAPMLSELSGWVASLPLGEALPFAAGGHPLRPPLRWNASLRVLGLVAGMGLARASTSVGALGHDERFDLRCAHWLIAGIAGVDPELGSIGSAFWARRLVSLDGGNLVDGVGHVPTGRSPEARYSPPLPSRAQAEQTGNLFVLDDELVEFAYGASRGAALVDTVHLQNARKQYTEVAARAPPAVRLGDAATSGSFWAGRESNAWAANASRFYTLGESRAVTTDEEDAAVAEALGSLHRAGKANRTRLLVLRTASDYTYPPAGVPIEGWFFRSELHFAQAEALDAIIRAGRPAVDALLARRDMTSSCCVRRDRQ